MSDDLETLDRDLGMLPLNSGRFIEAGLKRTAYRMKDSWRGHATGPSGAHASGYPPSVDYDVRGGMPSWEAEIGPSLGGQGSLGILEEAPGGVRANPQQARPKVISDNEADFERGMDRAIDDALSRAGL